MKRAFVFVVFLALVVVGCTSTSPSTESASVAPPVTEAAATPTLPLPTQPPPTQPPPTATATATPEPVAVPLDAEHIAQAEALVTLPLEDGVPYDVAFSPDGSLLAAGLTNGQVVFWRLPEGEVVRTIAAHTDRIFDIAFAPDGSLLASASEDGTAKVFTVADGAERFTVTMPENASEVHGVAFTADGERLVTASAEGDLGDRGLLRFWRVTDGSPLGTLGEPQWGALSMVAAAAQGQWLAAAHWEANQVRVWQGDAEAPAYTLTPNDDDFLAPLGGMAFAPAGDLLAVPVWGDPAGKIYIWSLDDGALRFVLEGHTHTHVYRVAFAPAGDLLASAGGDHTARFWRMSDGALVHTLTFDHNVHGVAFSPDGVWVAVAVSGAVEVWGVK